MILPPTLRCALPAFLAALLPVFAGLRSAEMPAPAGTPVDDEPGDEVVIAGLRGFTTLSTVVFEGAPDAPHRYETNYVFPGRARWWLSREYEGVEVRRISYRHAERVFELGMGERNSTELTGEDRAATLRSMELRRALFLWPEGFEWKRDGTSATAELAEGELAGSLLARTDEAGELESVTALVPGGEEQETLTVLGRLSQAGRSWPGKIRLSSGENSIWTESVEKVDPTRRYVDSFFVPPDRRPGSKGPGRTAETAVRRIDLPILCLRRFELPEGTDWEAAGRRAARLLEEERERLSGSGRELDPYARFEIDASGRPTFVLLSLREPGPTPKGWKRTEAVEALMLVLDDRAELSRARIDELLAAIPVGRRPMPAYVRSVGSPTSRRTEVVLPLVPVE